MKVTLVGTIAIFLIGLAGSAAASLEELEAVRQAIEEQGAKWNAAENPISLMSDQERLQLLGGELFETEPAADRLWRPKGDPKYPSSWNWHTYSGSDWMSPVRDQENCGACSAFASIGAFEGQINIEYNNPSKDVDLSEQHLFSCAGGTCSNGMYMDNALDYMKNWGVPRESCFPYWSGDSGQDYSCSQTCSDWRSQARKIDNWKWVSGSSNIKNRLQYGPMATSMLVYEDFYYYDNGVYQHTYGGSDGYHGIVLVGYSDSGGYWICKNSWSRYWGESGYFKIKYGQCEIAEYAAWMTYTPSGDDDDDSSDDDDYGDDDDEDRCKNICEKFYTCDLLDTQDVDPMDCLDTCMNELKESVKDCVYNADNCNEVEACVGRGDDDDDDRADDDDDNSMTNFLDCNLASGEKAGPFIGAFVLVLIFGISRLRRSRRSAD